MKQLLCIFLILLLLTGCAPAQKTPATPEPEAPQVTDTPTQPEADQPEPEEQSLYLGVFEAQTLTGETVTETIFADADLTVINVWATFCSPCKEEMPVLAQLDRELENVQLLGIVTDVIDQTGTPDDAQVELALELADLADCGYPNLILNESLAMLGFAGLSAVPATT